MYGATIKIIIAQQAKLSNYQKNLVSGYEVNNATIV